MLVVALTLLLAERTIPLVSMQTLSWGVAVEPVGKQREPALRAEPDIGVAPVVAVAPSVAELVVPVELVHLAAGVVVPVAQIMAVAQALAEYRKRVAMAVPELMLRPMPRRAVNPAAAAGVRAPATPVLAAMAGCE